MAKLKTEFKSTDDNRKARVAYHPFQDRAYCVFYTFPSGTEAMKGPFTSQLAAARWARGYIADNAN